MCDRPLSRSRENEPNTRPRNNPYQVSGSTDSVAGRETRLRRVAVAATHTYTIARQTHRLPSANRVASPVDEDISVSTERVRKTERVRRTVVPRPMDEKDVKGDSR